MPAHIKAATFVRIPVDPCRIMGSPFWARGKASICLNTARRRIRRKVAAHFT